MLVLNSTADTVHMSFAMHANCLACLTPPCDYCIAHALGTVERRSQSSQEYWVHVHGRRMPGVMGGAAMAQMQGMGHMGTLAAHAYHLGARGAAFPPAMSMGMMAETMGAPSAMGRPQQEGHQRPRPDGSLPQPWGPYSMRATYPRYEYE